ncbi:aminoacyl-tRNA hydrolase [Serinibacter arcticus]|uniref:Peptidyl-tRNA hydrolase n=1 Tax=Serinibacter arcticus TaxID=1655435 RepID=A0A2U1ZYG0_9MICO|nr:aminoacyl-tRNA hydrolase [Serinibacter arcticus]PWD51980.1 aminoacyl-tRNA hydrolase [Serinibacter arcticus]
MNTVWLVVGLANPGSKYAGNRHNVGAMVLDVLASRMNGSFTQHKARAAVLDARLGTLPGGVPGPRVILARPATYMNTSGGPVAALMQFYDVDAENLLVVHDELDIPEHQLRLKRGGGEGGHNGLRSISSSIGTRDYARLRVGVGRPPGRMDPADYVLSDFPAAQREELGVTLQLAADAVGDVVTQGLLASQNVWNTKD